MTNIYLIFNPLNSSDSPYLLAIFSAIIGAILASYFTILFSNWSNFSSAKKGLKSEIEYNMFVIETAYSSIKKGIDSYNQFLKDEDRKKYIEEMPELQILFQTSSFSYFTCQGFFEKINLDNRNSIMSCYDLFTRINKLVQNESDILFAVYSSYECKYRDRNVVYLKIKEYCDNISALVKKMMI